MTLDPRGLGVGEQGPNDPESRHRILGCCTGTGFALPFLKILYKQPLAEECMDA